MSVVGAYIIFITIFVSSVLAASADWKEGGMKGLERVSLRRLMMRFLTSRCRPVTLLLAFLGVWLLLSVFYFHSPSSAANARGKEIFVLFSFPV